MPLIYPGEGGGTKRDTCAWIQHVHRTKLRVRRGSEQRHIFVQITSSYVTTSIRSCTDSCQGNKATSNKVRTGGAPICAYTDRTPAVCTNEIIINSTFPNMCITRPWKILLHFCTFSADKVCCTKMYITCCHVALDGWDFRVRIFNFWHVWSLSGYAIFIELRMREWACCKEQTLANLQLHKVLIAGRCGWPRGIRFHPGRSNFSNPRATRTAAAAALKCEAHMCTVRVY